MSGTGFLVRPDMMLSLSHLAASVPEERFIVAIEGLIT